MIHTPMPLKKMLVRVRVRARVPMLLCRRCLAHCSWGMCHPRPMLQRHTSVLQPKYPYEGVRSRANNHQRRG